MKTLVCFGDSITADETFFDGMPRLNTTFARDVSEVESSECRCSRG